MSGRADVVGIVGAGRFGTALASTAARAGRRVVVWTRDAAIAEEINERRTNERRLPGARLGPSVEATTDPQRLADSARLVVVAVSSTQVRDRARALGEVIDGSHFVVHAIGALAEPDDVRVSRVLLEETPARQVGVLAGPALPHELVEDRFGSMVVASEFDAVTAEGRRLLGATELLRVYGGRDLIGVELAAAFAGAHTVALGLADALGVGSGPRAVLVTRAVAEASRLGEAAGADPRTFSGLAGLGNLLVRSSSDARERSRDYQLGRRLAAGKGAAGDELTEGARAAAAATRFAARMGVRVPIMQAVTAVVAGKLAPEAAGAAVAETVATDEWSA